MSRLLGTSILVVGALAAYGLATDQGFGTDTAVVTPVSTAAAGDIPPDYLALYQGVGATCSNLDWALVAAVGKVETDHGRSPLPGVHSGANSAGAAGPMQFLPATFAGVRDRHPDTVGPDQYNPADAIAATAHMLCDNGVADGRVNDAVWSYNHSDAYVTQVLTQAEAYR